MDLKQIKKGKKKKKIPLKLYQTCLITKVERIVTKTLSILDKHVSTKGKEKQKVKGKDKNGREREQVFSDTRPTRDPIRYPVALSSEYNL